MVFKKGKTFRSISLILTIAVVLILPSIVDTTQAADDLLGSSSQHSFENINDVIEQGNIFPLSISVIFSNFSSASSKPSAPDGGKISLISNLHWNKSFSYFLEITTINSSGYFGIFKATLARESINYSQIIDQSQETNLTKTWIFGENPPTYWNKLALTLNNIENVSASYNSEINTFIEERTFLSSKETITIYTEKGILIGWKLENTSLVDYSFPNLVDVRIGLVVDRPDLKYYFDPFPIAMFILILSLFLLLYLGKKIRSKDK